MGLRALASIVVALVLTGCHAPDHSAGPKELSWLRPGADRVAALTTMPATCAQPSPANSGDVSAQRRGELLFGSPFLLGGQAAKAGLSCSTCHVNGRTNPDFLFTGITGAAGTADVTQAFFGPRREDDVFNPVPIPDLAAPSGKQRVDRYDDAVIHAFLRAQIADEFEGSTPSDGMIRDLVAYLRPLDTGQCDPTAREPVHATDDLAKAMDAIRAASEPGAASSVDSDAFRLAARHYLGRIHDRYVARSHRHIREQLIKASEATANGATDEDVLASLRGLQEALASQEAQSLYAPRAMEAWLSARAASQDGR